jgi:hypothetical protein
LCDECDRPTHTYCNQPKLTEIPKGKWLCKICINHKKRPNENIPNRSPRKRSKSDSINLKQSEKLVPDPKISQSTKKQKIGKQSLDFAIPPPTMSISERVKSPEKRSRSPEKSKLPPLPPLNQKLSPKKSIVKTYKQTLLSSEKFKKRLSMKMIPKKQTSTDVEENLDPDTDDVELEPKKPFFGDKLSKQEADTSKCTPSRLDREYFNEAVQKVQSLDMYFSESAVVSDVNVESSSTIIPKIPKVRIGQYEIDAWYSAPYPEEYNRLHTLYLCKFCLKYMKSQFASDRHLEKCPLTHPPGDEIYHDGTISVFEVDGRKNKVLVI